MLERRDLVSLKARDAEPPANSVFAAPEHDRDGEDAHRVDEVIGQECMDEFGATLGEKIGAVSSRRRFTSAMSRRSTEPCQLVSTPPEFETTYFLIALKTFGMPPLGASSQTWYGQYGLAAEQEIVFPR